MVGTTYYFQVRGRYTDGQDPPAYTLGGWSATATATQRALPQKLQDIKAMAGNTEVTLSWGAPAVEYSVFNYDYRQSIDGGTTWEAWQNFFTTIPNSYVVTGLSNDVAHSFQVRARNSQGPGPDSDTVTVTPLGPPAAPSLGAEAKNLAVRLYWANPNDASITKYQIQRREEAGAFTSWKDIVGSSATTTEATVSGLTNGTAYTFQVRAVSGRGDGEAASVTATPQTGAIAPGATIGVTATTPTPNLPGPATPIRVERKNTPTTSPAPPVAPTVVAAAGTTTSGEIALSWTGLPAPSGGSLIFFEYRQSTDDGRTWSPDWTEIPSSDGSTDAYAVTGLAPGVPYTFQVRAVAGTTDNPVYGAAAQFAPVTLGAPDPPTSLAVMQVTDDNPDTSEYEPQSQLTLSWTAPSGGVTPTSYQYRQRTEQAGGSWENWVDTGTMTTHTVTGLAAGTTYEFEVQALARTIAGPSSNVASATTLVSATLTVPEAPTGLTATAGNGEVTLSWNNPQDQHITGYVYLQTVGTTVTEERIDKADARTITHTVTGLTNGDTYTFQVQAENTEGRSLASNSDTVTPREPDDPEGPGEPGPQAFRAAFGAARYEAKERGEAVTILVQLSRAADRELRIPISVHPQGATQAGDYTVALLDRWDAGAGTGDLIFSPGDTAQTFTMTANEDADIDDETVALGFGTLPERVSAGTPATSVVVLNDTGLLWSAFGAFGAAHYEAKKRGEAVTILVQLSRAADRELRIPITVRPQGATQAGDYTVALIDRWDAGAGTGDLIFSPGDTAQTFTMTANEDADIDDETVALGFGTLPETISAGPTATAIVTLKDTGLVPLSVSFAQAEYPLTGGDEGVRVDVHLSPAADRRVDVPLAVNLTGGATRADYEGVPASIVFEVGMTAVTIEVTAQADQARPANARLILSFGELPPAVSVGALATTTITVRPGRSAAAFEQSLEVTLAAVARSVAESAQAGIEGRFERYRQARRRPVAAAETTTAREIVPAGLAVNQWSAGEPALVRAGAAADARAQRVLSAVAPAAPAWPTGYGDDPTRVAPEFSARPVADHLLSQTAFNLQVGESAATTSGWIPVVWGAGDLQHFSGTPSQRTSYRGDLQAAQVGMDLYTGAHALVGVSYMRSWGKADYTAEGFDGVMDNRLDTAYPYLYWQPHARVSVWGMGGIGSGRVDVTEVGRTHDAAASAVIPKQLGTS